MFLADARFRKRYVDLVNQAARFFQRRGALKPFLMINSDKLEPDEIAEIVIKRFGLVSFYVPAKLPNPAPRERAGAEWVEPAE
jgi:hypothetical protein